MNYRSLSFRAQGKEQPPLSRLRSTLLLFSIILLLVGCNPLERFLSPTPEPPPPPEDAPVATPLRLFVLPDEGVRPILQVIADARETIRMKVYLFTETDVIDALENAVARGVEVKVILELAPAGGGDNAIIAEQLREIGAEVQFGNPVFRLTHEKSIVVDERLAVIMTANLTRSAFTRNREYGVVITEPVLVQEIVEVFEADWFREAIDLSEARLIWSPDNSRESILAFINQAQHALDLQQAALLDEEVNETLVQAAQRGVRVRVTTPPPYGPEDPQHTVLGELEADGIEVRLLVDPYVHAKTFLADGERAVVGSINSTSASIDFNRELAIEISHAASLRRMRQVFDADWEKAIPFSDYGARVEGIISWEEAGEYIGQDVTVEGVIVRTNALETITFLDFTEERDAFNLVIFASDRRRWEEPPEELYLNKRIQVQGVVETFRDSPQIVVRRPAQIAVLSDGE